jgi:hypothetical protein
MKAAIFEQPGLKNLRIMDNIKKPELTDHKQLKVKVWKKFKLDNVTEAIEALSAKKETVGLFWI